MSLVWVWKWVDDDCCLFLQMANTEEYIDGQLAGNLGEVLIRYSCMQIWILISKMSVLFEWHQYVWIAQVGGDTWNGEAS